MKLKLNAILCSLVVALLNGLCVSLSFAIDDDVHPVSLEISVYDVSINRVEIDWHYKEESVASELLCEIVYGPVDDVTQVEVLPRIQLSNKHIIKLSPLKNNVTYHMHMVCHNGTGERIQSNALQFTTGSKSLPYVMPSNSFHGHSSIPREHSSVPREHSSVPREHSSTPREHSSIPRENSYSRDEDYVRTVRSSSVILGAVCGIVGFLIINVTIVMAVRKYSHRQMRRRRILEIEERDYDEFPYLRGDE